MLGRGAAEKDRRDLPLGVLTHGDPCNPRYPDPNGLQSFCQGIPEKMSFKPPLQQTYLS